MENAKIFKAYKILKDSGQHSEEEILNLFKERGVDLQAEREKGTLISPNEMEEISPTVDMPFVGRISQAQLGDHQKAQGKFGDYLVNVFREFGQGISFSSADELEAWLGSVTGGEPFEEGLKTVQAKIKKFRESPENERLSVLGMDPSTAAQVAGGLSLPFKLSSELLTKLPSVAPVAGQFVRNLLRRGLTGGAVGAGENYLYGVGESEGNIFDRMGSEKSLDYAKTGALIGPVLGMGGGLVSDGVESLVNKSVAKNRKAQQAILAAMKMDNSDLSDFDKQLDDLVGQGEKEILELQTLTDLAKPGGMVQKGAEVTTLSIPETMAGATGVLTERAGKFAELGRNQVKKSLARRVNDPKQFRDRVTLFAKNIAQPFYDIADPKMVDMPHVASEIKRLMKQKDKVGKMVRDSWESARVKMPEYLKKKVRKGQFGEWGSTPFPKEGPIGPMPILYYDTFRKFLDENIKGMAKTLKNKTIAEADEGEMYGIRNLVSKELKARSPEYEKATGIWENGYRNNNAFDLGMKHHKDTTVSGQMVRSVMSGYKNGSQKQAYRMGYAYGMYNKIQNTNLAWPNEAKVLRLFSEEEPEKLKYLFRTPELAQNFVGKIKKIGDMDYVGKQILKGSPTFQRQQIEKLINGEASLGTRALDTVNSMRGLPKAAGDINESLTKKGVASQMEGMGEILMQPGEANMRKNLGSLRSEKSRWANQKKGERQAPAFLPSLLSPGYREWDAPPKVFDWAVDNLGVKMF
jgi:hypothetical protein